MRIHTYITHCEVRRVTLGVRKKDNSPFILLKLEDMDGDAFEATCRDQQLFGYVEQLKKGDVIDVKCTIMATDKYQFVTVDSAPEICED